MPILKLKETVMKHELIRDMDQLDDSDIAGRAALQKKIDELDSKIQEQIQDFLKKSPVEKTEQIDKQAEEVKKKMKKGQKAGSMCAMIWDCLEEGMTDVNEIATVVGAATGTVKTQRYKWKKDKEARGTK